MARLFLVICSAFIFSSAMAQLDEVVAHYGALPGEDSGTTLHFIQPSDELVEDFSKLSQIILIRHGEPALEHKGWRNRKEAIAYFEAYDSVGIFPPDFIPLELAPNELEVIHTSSIQRAISTAELVFHQPELQQPDPLFREFEKKVLWFFKLRLPTSFWRYGSRILWVLGFNTKGIERYSEARERAEQAAIALEEDAQAKGKTLLVAHGVLNHFIDKNLQDRGWTKVYDGGNGYLSQVMLVKYK